MVREITGVCEMRLIQCHIGQRNPEGVAEEQDMNGKDLVLDLLRMLVQYNLQNG